MVSKIVITLSLADISPLVVVALLPLSMLFNRKIRHNKMSLIIVLLCSIIIGYFIINSYNNTLSLSDNRLEVKAGGFYKDFQTLNGCRKVASFNKSDNYGLSYRTSGIAFMNYKAGFFSDHENHKVFVLITGKFENATLYKFNQDYLLLENNPDLYPFFDSGCESKLLSY